MGIKQFESLCVRCCSRRWRQTQTGFAMCGSVTRHTFTSMVLSIHTTTFSGEVNAQMRLKRSHLRVGRSLLLWLTASEVCLGCIWEQWFEINGLQPLLRQVVKLMVRDQTLETGKMKFECAFSGRRDIKKGKLKNFIEFAVQDYNKLNCLAYIVFCLDLTMQVIIR